mmetsp:Transcript_124813/g.312140  ORF Transcript_124813/g.312140 Transcript_124813/m.312140 type:complete len:328 (+) Transcript_124813:110-1093(+)
MGGNIHEAGRFNTTYAPPLVDPLLLVPAEGGVLPMPSAVPLPFTSLGLVDESRIALASVRSTSGHGCILSTDPPVLREAADALDQDAAQLSCPNQCSNGGSRLFLSTSPVSSEPQHDSPEQKSPEHVVPSELARDAAVVTCAEQRSEASSPVSLGSEGSASVGEDKLQYCPGEMLKRSAELIQDPGHAVPTNQQLPCLLGATRKVLNSSFNAADITPEKVIKPGASQVNDNEFEVLADADAKPALVGLGSSALPTVGSLTHNTGSCKPCAFVFKDGCQNGVDCQFCHLCEPGEKKRRKKDWKEARRSTAFAMAAISAASPFTAVFAQ